MTRHINVAQQDSHSHKMELPSERVFVVNEPTDMVTGLPTRSRNPYAPRQTTANAGEALDQRDVLPLPVINWKEEAEVSQTGPCGTPCGTCEERDTCDDGTGQPVGNVADDMLSLPRMTF